MNLKKLWVAAILIAGFAWVPAEGEWPELKYICEAQLTQSEDSFHADAYYLELTDSMYQKIQTAKMTDIRVMDSDFNDIPYFLREKRQKKEYVISDGETIVLPKNRNEWTGEVIVSLPKEGEGVEYVGMEILPYLTNYMQMVRVEALDANGQSLEVLNDGELIFSLSGNDQALVRNFVPFSHSSNARSYRMVFEPVLGNGDILPSLFKQINQKMAENPNMQFRTPQSVRMIYHRRVSEIVPEQRTYELVQDSRRENFEADITVFDFKSDRQPLQALTLETGDGEFVREVSVLAGDDLKSLRPIGSRLIAKFDIERKMFSEMTIDIEETRAEFYRLVVDNSTEQESLHDLKVTGIGKVYEMIMFPPVADKISIYMGGTLTAPDYSGHGSFAEGNLAVARHFQPGEVQNNPSFNTMQIFQRSTLIRLMPLLLAIVAAGIGIGVHFAIRRINQSPPEP